MGTINVVWGEPVAGREKETLEAFGAAQGMLDELAKDGRIAGHREYFPVTGHRSIIMQVEGPLPDLYGVLTDEPFQKALTEARLLTREVDVQVWAGGNDSEDRAELERIRTVAENRGYL